MGLVDFAKKELELIKAFDKEGDFYGGMTGKSVLELIEVFAKQGHSGMNAGIVRQLFHKLADYKPLSPLTLEDDEWNQGLDGSSLYQNKRNFSVFKDGKDGRAYYGKAYTKKTQKGTCWSGRLDLPNGKYLGKCYIKDFNNLPTICIDVIETEVKKDDWEMEIKDLAQLRELRKYYDFNLLDIEREEK